MRVTSINEILCPDDIYLCIKDCVKDYCCSYLFYDISRQVARIFICFIGVCRGGCSYPPVPLGGNVGLNQKIGTTAPS